MEQTLRKGLFRTKWPVVSKIMSFLRDDFSLGDFNGAVGKALYWPGATYSFDASSDEEIEETVHVHFDGDGRGPYGRADIDIIIVADSVEEARPIVEATIAKVAKRYKNHRIYETPCSVQIIGDFPQRHVQIVTVLNKSLDELSALRRLGLHCAGIRRRDTLGLPTLLFGDEHWLQHRAAADVGK